MLQNSRPFRFNFFSLVQVNRLTSTTYCQLATLLSLYDVENTISSGMLSLTKCYFNTCMVYNFQKYLFHRPFAYIILLGGKITHKYFFKHYYRRVKYYAQFIVRNAKYFFIVYICLLIISKHVEVDDLHLKKNEIT